VNRKKGKVFIDPDKEAGMYFLRTSLQENDEKTLWGIYNVIREIVYTFRELKSDLDLRSIYHKSDEATRAHLNLGILAIHLPEKNRPFKILIELFIKSNNQNVRHN